MHGKYQRMVAFALGTVLLLGSVSPAFAADRLRTRDRDRLKDGSCLAADQLRIRDRLKDGSCLAADQLRTRDQDRLKDGSCLAADQLRTRDRLYGSCEA